MLYEAGKKCKMRAVKKYLSFFFAVFLCAGSSILVASCSRLLNRAPEPLIVYVPENSGLTQIIKTLSGNFTSKTNIPVALEISVSETTDIVTVDAGSVLTFAKTNKLESLDDVLSAAESGEILPEAKAAHARRGKLLSVPFAARLWVMMYNDDMLRKAGHASPPGTWDAFVNAALQVKSKHLVNAPVAWAWKDQSEIANAFTAVTLSFGGKLFDEKGIPLFQNEQGLFALVFMKQSLGRTTDPASFSMNSAGALNSYMEGKNAIVFGWHTWNAAANGGETSKIRGHSRFAPVPGMMENLQTTLLDTAAFGLLTSAPHNNSAKQFIHYMLSREAQKEMMVRFGWFSVLNPLYEDPELAEMLPLLPRYASFVHLAKATYKGEDIRKLESVLSNEIIPALLGKKNLKQALDDAATQLKTMTKVPAS